MSPPNAESHPHLLVLAGPHLSASAFWPQDLDPAGCEFCPDVYSVVARLAAAPKQFLAVVLAPGSLSPAVLAALPLIRRHTSIPLWMLPAPGGGSRVDEAFKLGAVPLTPDLLLRPVQAPEPPAGNGSRPVEPPPKPAAVSVPPAAPAPVAPRTVISIPDSALQAELSEEEIKALLGPDF